MSMEWIDAYEKRPETNKPLLYIDYDRGFPMTVVGWWSGRGFVGNGLRSQLSRNARYYVYEESLNAPPELELPDDFEW